MRRSSSAIFKDITILGATMSLSVCSEMFERIYGGPIEAEMRIKESSFPQINTTEYTNWVYIDLLEHKATTVEVEEEHKSEIPAKWSLAIHRYDIKTSESTAFQTACTSIDDLKTSEKLPAEENFIKDEQTTDKIAIDMSGMMERNIKYTEDYRDDILSDWLNVDTSSMPPIYTIPSQVYLIQLKDNTYAAIRFINYTNARGIKGCIDFDFLYPLDFEENN